MSASPLVQIDDLSVVFRSSRGLLGRSHDENRAVDGVTLGLAEGEVLGVVGESGSGKSVLLRSLMRLRRPSEGSITFAGRDIWELDRKDLKQFRQSVALVFQNALASFPPGMRVGDVLAEPLIVNGIDGAARRSRIEEALRAVGMDVSVLGKRPRQLSGGQRQRIGIARALTLKPSVLLLDEPVSALDVSIQAQVLNLFLDLQREYGLTYLVAAHDLAVLKHTCDRVAVLENGKVVELGTTEQVFSSPAHPYTRALLAAVPTISRALGGDPAPASHGHHE
jgi:ABC-type glutathione transport system ATPase component